MDGEKANEALGRLMFLEENLGTSTRYETLEPYPINPTDVVALQTAAATIARFLGLGEITFVISLVTLPAGVAGQIELDRSKQTAFVELDRTQASVSERALAILAHELTHKFLEVNATRFGSLGDRVATDELMTDTAAIFLGLGKIILNGAQTTENGGVSIQHGPPRLPPRSSPNRPRA